MRPWLAVKRLAYVSGSPKEGTDRGRLIPCIIIMMHGARSPRANAFPLASETLYQALEFWHNPLEFWSHALEF